ncbi:MAG: hypothetical protein ACI3X9_04390 [Bacteroidaceae bacterium]
MSTKTNQDPFVSCMECRWATLMQWYENPVVAQCAVKGDRQVAASRRICKEYKKRADKPQIQHFDSYQQ